MSRSPCLTTRTANRRWNGGTGHWTISSALRLRRTVDAIPRPSHRGSTIFYSISRIGYPRWSMPGIDSVTSHPVTTTTLTTRRQIRFIQSFGIGFQPRAAPHGPDEYRWSHPSSIRRDGGQTQPPDRHADADLRVGEFPHDQCSASVSAHDGPAGCKQKKSANRYSVGKRGKLARLDAVQVASETPLIDLQRRFEPHQKGDSNHPEKR